MLSRFNTTTLVTVLLTFTLFSAARADQSGEKTLALNVSLDLDTGALSQAGGDIRWDGTALMPQGRAATYNLGKSGARLFKAIKARSATSAPYKAIPIPADLLVPGDIFGVHTNGGNYAKVMVTAVDGTSLRLQYTTFAAAGATPATSGPVVTQVLNNYSYTLPGLPNAGIAPGSLFIIFGTGLSTSDPPVLQSSVPPGLPTKLNQTSVSVTVGGVTVTPALYYTSATAVAAVLPSKTPVGTGTITLTYNGQASAPMQIQVVASALGLDTYYGTGNGLGTVTDNATGAIFGPTQSAKPGQVVVLWGSGIGADPGNDDLTYPQNLNNLTSIPFQVYVGGIAATVLYHGRSQYPGVDQIDITIPQNVPLGCFVSVVAVSGSVASNSITLPIAANGGTCSDPLTGLSGTQIQTLARKSTPVNGAFVTILQQSNGGGTSSAAFAIASGLAGTYFGQGYEYVSQGSCVIVPPGQGSINNVFQSPLDVGTIQMSGPKGNVPLSGGNGLFQGDLPGAVTSSPGTYTFTASGGKDIKGFTVALNVSAPLTLTNAPSLATITRTQDTVVSWSGGFPGSDVQVAGDVGGTFGTVRFFCHAPSSAGQLTIPASILAGMASGSGALVVYNTTAPQTISATGLDVGFAVVTAVTKVDTRFK